jgi:simple sugar transport system ATP-binding protein
LFNPQAIADHAQRLIGTFNIRTRTAQTKVSHLSGGNQQRVILAREINNNPDLLVAVQPTRGLDIGATEYIHRQLLAQRARGAAVLLISTELEEILALSDRIDIIYEGKIVGEVTAKNADIIRIGKMMAGVSDDDARRHSN